MSEKKMIELIVIKRLIVGDFPFDGGTSWNPGEFFPVL